MDLSESVMVMILERLRIRDISRMKLVCREWKTLFESSYFRDLYVTINQRYLSSPWSILYSDISSNTALEFFCERWGFTQSIGSCVSRFLCEMHLANKSRQVSSALAFTDGLILLGILTKDGPNFFSVANPVMRQWIDIPEPLPFSPYNDLKGAALVTDMNNGDLLGYKVVKYGLEFQGANLIYLQIFSSDTGNWTCHYVPTLRFMINLPSNPINLNGYLHWLCCAQGFIVAYNFYAPTMLSHVIHLPQRLAKGQGQSDQETLTISCGSLMYMETDTGKPNQQLSIWRLKNYTSYSSKESWELLWNLMPGHGLDLYLAITVPVAMHPFDKEIVYLVTRQTDYSHPTHAYLVSGNLGTKKFQVHKDWKQNFGYYKPHPFHQFVLPQRLGSIPCPPGCTLLTLPDQH